VVFVINNNQWAISAPRNIQTAAQTLAQKGIAAGIEGRQVDGNDVIAVRHVIQEAVEKARTGDGPTLIEAISYRLGDHTTADDATRYRDPDVVRQQWALEPIARLRNHLVRANAWGKEQEDRLLKECSEAINQAVDDYLATPAPATEAMFDHLYAQLPDAMREQRATALRFAPAIGERDG
jgi:pyruvate dehydrogenase E1 component alpha subunit